jgi:hypothetical protein
LIIRSRIETFDTIPFSVSIEKQKTHPRTSINSQLTTCFSGNASTNGNRDDFGNTPSPYTRGGTLARSPIEIWFHQGFLVTEEREVSSFGILPEFPILQNHSYQPGLDPMHVLYALDASVSAAWNRQ